LVYGLWFAFYDDTFCKDQHGTFNDKAAAYSLDSSEIAQKLRSRRTYSQLSNMLHLCVANKAAVRLTVPGIRRCGKRPEVGRTVSATGRSPNVK